MKEPVKWWMSAIFLALVVVFVVNPPADSSAWASWVQAFGSIAAIGLAIWLQQRANEDKSRAARVAAASFIVRFNVSLGILELAVARQTWGEFHDQLAVLEEVMLYGRAIPFVDTTSLQQEVMVDLRAIGALLLAQNAAPQQVRSWSALDAQIAEFRARVDAHSKSIGLRTLGDALLLAKYSSK